MKSDSQYNTTTSIDKVEKIKKSLDKLEKIEKIMAIPMLLFSLVSILLEFRYGKSIFGASMTIFAAYWIYATYEHFIKAK